MSSHNEDQHEIKNIGFEFKQDYLLHLRAQISTETHLCTRRTTAEPRGCLLFYATVPIVPVRFSLVEIKSIAVEFRPSEFTPAHFSTGGRPLSAATSKNDGELEMPWKVEGQGWSLGVPRKRRVRCCCTDEPLCSDAAPDAKSNISKIQV
jgi:hypothetical protein